MACRRRLRMPNRIRRAGTRIMPIIRQHKPKPLCEERPHLCRQAQQQQGKPNKARNAAKAVKRIVKAVVRRERVFVSDAQKQQRLATCRACTYWNEGGNIGLGECKHPGCGCTRFKHGLATETCPIGKWPALALTNGEPASIKKS